MMRHKKILFEMCLLDHIENIERQERTTMATNLKDGLSNISKQRPINRWPKKVYNIHPAAGQRRTRANMIVIAILFSLSQFLTMILKTCQNHPAGLDVFYQFSALLYLVYLYRSLKSTLFKG